MKGLPPDETAPDVAPDFWDWPPLRAALASHHIGRISKAYRKHPAHRQSVTQELLAKWLDRTQGAVSRLERVSEAPRDLTVLIRYAQVLKVPRAFLWFDVPDQVLPFAAVENRPVPRQAYEPIRRESDEVHALSYQSSPAQHHGLVLDPRSATQFEAVRRRITDALGTTTVTDFSLDEWEQSVLLYGEATRWADGHALIISLLADFSDLERQLGNRQTTRTQRRLCRLVAQLAGLTSLIFTKLGAYDSARDWARTARLAASEAGDLMISAWVEAQEAYALFYEGGSPVAAIQAAKAAQSVSKAPSVGKALAAALEARAQSLLTNKGATLRALANANEVLSQLSNELRGQSAFGYNEAQLSFHEGNALVNLGEVASAWEAQKRALALYPVRDSDRILVHLDRAVGLARIGELEESLTHALEALIDTPAEQRSGIVISRTRQLVAEVQQGGRSPIGTRGKARALLEITGAFERSIPKGTV